MFNNEKIGENVSRILCPHKYLLIHIFQENIDNLVQVVWTEFQFLVGDENWWGLNERSNTKLNSVNHLINIHSKNILVASFESISRDYQSVRFKLRT